LPTLICRLIADGSFVGAQSDGYALLVDRLKDEAEAEAKAKL